MNSTSLDYPITDANGSCVAHVIFNEVGGDDGDQCRADAALIAAAPDMLAVLKAVYPLIGRGFVQVGSTLRSGKGHIEAAIAKAEGRDQ